MKKKSGINYFILILFFVLSTFNYSVYGNKIGEGVAKDTSIQIPINTNTIKTITIRENNKNKISKRELQVEIKRRKKHHKALLKVYNDNFSPDYLSLITDNSEKLKNLRDLLYS